MSIRDDILRPFGYYSKSTAWFDNDVISMVRSTFTGPLFIIGMPRSGTKLFRDLLNRNDRIGIPRSESHFIPYLVERFGNPPRFDDTASLDEFFEALSNTNFYLNMREMGRSMTRADLEPLRDRDSWHAVLACVFRFYVEGDKARDCIWGDKSPIYINHLPLLNRLFPQARFLHLIRDPRDYCLSVNRAWGKNMLRAADAWHKSQLKVLNERAALGDRYLAVKYEQLLSDPRATLRRVCDFLDCRFSEKMLSLATATENLGDAKGQKEILRHNRQKYLQRMSRRRIKRIEEITFSSASAFGYDMDFAQTDRPLSVFSLAALTLHDAAASARFYTASKGVGAGLAYLYRFHRQRVHPARRVGALRHKPGVR